MEAHMFASILLEEAGPNTELSWLLYLFLAFFFLMVLVGWWVSRRGGGQAEVPPATNVHHEEPMVHAEPAAVEVRHETPVVTPETPAVAAPVAIPDDLVRLEGIGPKVARVLNDAGITTFAALAAANPVEIQKTLSAAGLQMMNPEGWIEQATLAAKGDWAGLEKLQSELKGGRRR
jgi:large subunit ribosomal protein L17